MEIGNTSAVDHQLTGLSRSANRLVFVLAVAILFTSSFDIFLIVEAGGNYRFCQLLVPVLVGFAVIKSARSRIITVLGLLPLLIWLAFQVCFIPVTDFWPKSLGYCLWLLLNLGMVFSFVQLFSGNLRTLTSLLRWYAWSFAVIAVFGVIQFALPVLGFPAPLIQQWWVPGLLPRSNGFSYEPSYFATYLLIGFVFAGSLRRAKSTLLSPRSSLAICIITGTGIVLSSSRMGIVFLLIDILLPLTKPWLSFLADIRRFRIDPSKGRRVFASLLWIGLMASGAAGTLAALERNPAVLLMFLGGTGVSDTAAHSVVQRASALEDTLTVFTQHPLVGRSLGGVSCAIAELEGEKVSSFEDSKNFEGMSVFAEALAASGVIGILPFIWFLFESARKPLVLARTVPPFFSPLLHALVRSLIFTWAILQLNQNMLRPYLWVHLAVLACVYAAARRHRQVFTAGNSQPARPLATPVLRPAGRATR